MHTAYGRAPVRDSRTVSVLNETLRRKNTSLEGASELSGVALADLRKLHDGDAASIRVSTLIALCTALDCAPEDVLRVQNQPQQISLRKEGLIRRTVAYQSRVLSTLALLAGSTLSVWFLVAVVSQINPVDFYVYHYAASLAFAGENIYAGNIQGIDMPAGGLPFTYAPFAALVLLPLNLFPAPVAYLLWSGASALIMTSVLRNLLPPVHRNKPFIVGALALTASGSIVMASHIIFGQINVFLMALVLFDVCRNNEGRFLRRIPRGALIGVAAAVKLTPALFIVYFIISGQKRAAAGSALAAGAATVLAFMIFPEMSLDFMTRVLWNLSDTVSLNGFFATSGNNSIQGAFAALGTWTALPALVLTLAVAALGLNAASITYRRGEAVQAAIIVGLTACLVSPVSWMHHWVYLLPGLIVLWKQGGQKTRAFCYVSAVILLATGPNLGDILFSFDQPLLLPLAVTLRESLLLMGIVSIALLARGVRDRVTDSDS
ncbi:glycosyltransferase 87 family protein [Pseudarthrobacter sp. AB1]|uniref:glycosyltransferase 87 family protein n=1 Tax=Pseudarthrobacter sp. AB1 TaxID=2138309 RepID=UPI00186B593A|nr:glycosyltransferase 87 family protein [Pseudarthrobacter sp. AB1]MBE4720564.1 glycosyl transferase [Pseudarthrobacter sp. AB1]